MTRYRVQYDLEDGVFMVYAREPVDAGVVEIKKFGTCDPYDFATSVFPQDLDSLIAALQNARTKWATSSSTANSLT